jgi:sulfur carrier protein ThiS
MESITIRVRGIAQLKELLGSNVGPVSVPEGTTVQDLLVLLGARLGEAFCEKVRESGADVMYPPIRVMVNGSYVGHQRRAGHVLQDGDDVLLLTPLGGG